MSVAETATNPLRTGLRMGRTPQACVLVIFGASGDLTKRKLLPALWALAEDQQLAPGFSVVGIARTPKSHAQFRQELRESVADDTTGEESGLSTLPGR